MNTNRRAFLRLSGLAAGAAALPRQREAVLPAKIQVRDPLPISVEERNARIVKAQGLMREHKLDGLVLDAGTSMEYFTGVRWWPSERTMVAVIPAKGNPIYISPAFEEARLRELISIGETVLTWQEDENPFRLIHLALKRYGDGFNNAAIEERTRFFIADGLRQIDPQYNYVSGDPVTIPCRIIKSPAELALMQRASDITVEAIKDCIRGLKAGMSTADAAALVNETQSKWGGSNGDALILFGAASALPHGSRKAQPLKKGDIVLMDCGCQVHGYTSDITRTIVFGAAPTERQASAWLTEQKAQAAAFSAARNGMPCETVDAAARSVLVAAGYGPDYKIPGLPHRTGHGIGMDGHEWGNMVRGNKMLLQPGMCFSLEPTLVLPDEFGVRMEDCVYMSPEGANWFSRPAVSIDRPFG